jgi:hypothetical protein
LNDEFGYGFPAGLRHFHELVVRSLHDHLEHGSRDIREKAKGNNVHDELVWLYRSYEALFDGLADFLAELGQGNPA